MIITIDGPAGAGKSSTAQAVADRLDMRYLDTGALYRAVAWVLLEAGDAPTDEQARMLLADATIDLAFDEDDTLVVTAQGRVITEAIRTSDVGDMASQVAALPAVREYLLPVQRKLADRWSQTDGGVVADGRDTGTIVFPNADLKIYMHASLDERARRRWAEYQQDAENPPSLEDVREEIRTRDQADRNRDIAPLRRPEDAVELDTTCLSFEEQVEAIQKLVIDAMLGTDLPTSH